MCVFVIFNGYHLHHHYKWTTTILCAFIAIILIVSWLVHTFQVFSTTLHCLVCTMWIWTWFLIFSFFFFVFPYSHRFSRSCHHHFNIIFLSAIFVVVVNSNCSLFVWFQNVYLWYTVQRKTSRKNNSQVYEWPDKMPIGR